MIQLNKINNLISHLKDGTLFDTIDRDLKNILVPLDERIMKNKNNEVSKVNKLNPDTEIEYINFAEFVLKNENLSLLNLSNRQLKYISLSPKLLYNSEVFLPFVTIISKSINLNQKNLIRIIISYLINYNAIPSNVVLTIKFKLNELLLKISDGTKIRSSLNPINEKRLFFSENPAEDTAKYIVQHYGLNFETVSNCKSFYNLGLGDLFNNCILYIFRLLLADFIQNKEIIYSQILDEVTLSQTTLSKIVSSLILEVADKYNYERSDLTRKILNLKNSTGSVIFGDPRLHKENWMLVAADATSKFKNWLNEKNIEFFFSVIFEKNQETAQDRNDFWLHYAKYVIDVRFFMSQRHLNYAHDKLEQAKIDIGLHYGKVSSGESSLFIMEFEHFYVVEASTSGYLSLRIYSKNLGENFVRLRSRVNVKEVFKENEVSISVFSRDGAVSLEDAVSWNIDKEKAIKITHNASTWRASVSSFMANYNLR